MVSRKRNRTQEERGKSEEKLLVCVDGKSESSTGFLHQWLKRYPQCLSSSSLPSSLFSSPLPHRLSFSFSLFLSSLHLPIFGQALSLCHIKEHPVPLNLLGAQQAGKGWHLPITSTRTTKGGLSSSLCFTSFNQHQFLWPEVWNSLIAWAWDICCGWRAWGLNQASTTLCKKQVPLMKENSVLRRWRCLSFLFL